MASERAKVSELQANHLALSRELAAAKSHEVSQRRELVVASDEIDALKKRHQREVADLETDLKKREREGRELGQEVRVLRGDLERERESVSMLKATLSSQATAHLTLTTQNNLLQAQISALQSTLDTGTSSISSLRLELETAQRRVEELETEAREAEGVRRKLHNMVQELKGNIRVFCRVRPVLPSDGEEEADMRYPDRRDHREIVLESTSESAMGQERKEVYNFGFDRVTSFRSLARYT
jgi:kinesin family protein C1